MSLKHDSEKIGRSLEQLAQAQGVPSLDNPKILAGGWPDGEDVDEFLEDVYSSRRHIVTTRAWGEASESQRREWALAVLETLRDAYGELRLDDRLAVKRALADARGEL